MGLGSALLRLGGVWIQSVGGVKRLIALYYGKIEALQRQNLSKFTKNKKWSMYSKNFKKRDWTSTITTKFSV